MIISEKWLTMALLCVSGGTIYWFPFLSEIYYVPMQDAFGFSKTQIGVLSATFGFTSLVGYIPGGWLADRKSSRKLMSVALLLTSAGGFVFSTLPSFEICVFLYGFWGLVSGCVFWSALINRNGTRVGAPGMSPKTIKPDVIRTKNPKNSPRTTDFISEKPCCDCCKERNP